MKKVLATLILFLTVFLSNRLSAQVTFETYKYSGTIGGNAVFMTFYANECAGCSVNGDYYYIKYNKKIEFRSTYNSLKIIESVNGKDTGYFIFKGNYQAGKYNPDADGGPAAYDFPDKLIGKWYTMNGTKSYDVVLKKNENR